METRVKKIISRAEYAVFFGGAGMSTESGIPDFRSVDGLYHQKYAVPPEEILSHRYFVRHTAEFFRFYRDKLDCRGAKPNPAHLALAELERRGKLKAVITQNIDGLHQAAGSKRVLELHGSVYRNTCTECGRFYPAETVFEGGGFAIPHCSCGGVIKPDVVLYGEQLDDGVVGEAVAHIARADVLIIAGTSLTVYPAAGLIQYFRGNELILINRDPTPYDGEATLCVHDAVGRVLALAPGEDLDD